MPPEGIVIIVALGCGAATIIVKMITSTVLRLQQGQQRRAVPTELEERLARIEAAVEAIAIEVERSGELQRFSARLAERPALPEPPRQ